MNPTKDDNTIKTAAGISAVMGITKISEKNKLFFAYATASVMQALFLRKDRCGELFGYDINIKEQRDEMLDLFIDNFIGN
jgi:hypothetical protein